MMDILTKVTFLLFVTIVSSKYNCNSEGQTGCLHVGKCTYFGNCECTPGFNGYDCGLRSALRSYGPSCRTTCLNGGTCYSGSKCYCTEEFHGNRCQYKMESVKCGLEGMEITVVTSLRFSGEITAKPNTTGCTFQEAYSHNVTTRRLHKLIVPLSLQPSNPCYKAINRTVTNDNVTYAVDVAVSEKKEVYNPLRDRLVVFKCVYPRRIGKGSTNDITQTYTPVELTYLDSNQQPLTTGVQEGDVFFIDFSPTEESGATGLQVISLEAFSVHNGKVTTFKMIEKGCILLAAEARVKSLDTVEDTRQTGQIIYKTRIEMTAFSLYGNSYLHFNYDLKYCQGPCPQILCSQSTPARLQIPNHNRRFGPGLSIVI